VNAGKGLVRVAGVLAICAPENATMVASRSSERAVSYASQPGSLSHLSVGVGWSSALRAHSGELDLL